MGYPVTLVRGDGIGPEIADAARLAIAATGVAIDWHVVDAGQTAFAKQGTPLPESVLDSIRHTKVALKGPLSTPIEQSYRSVNIELRQQLQLFANFRPITSIPGIKSPFTDVDLVVIRENTEDLYAGIEYERTSIEAAKVLDFLAQLSSPSIRADSAIGIKLISVLGSRRIVEYAFQFAQAHGRQKVTAAHKANVMKFTDGLFLDVAREVAKLYPNIEFEDCIVDHLCLKLVQNPNDFDVLVAPNLYGDILADLGAGLIGGTDIAPGASLGHEYAIFETYQSPNSDIAGQDQANPTALILAGELLLKHLNETAAAQKLRQGVEQVISSLSEPLGTQAMAAAIASAISA